MWGIHPYRNLTVVVAILVGFQIAPSFAADIHIVDGDTLDLNGTRYRLHGIDAPEAGQKCNRPYGKTWKCGARAIDLLTALVAGKEVTCDHRDVDDYDRVIAVCKVDGLDLNDLMVRHGHAWAFRKYSRDYVEAEAEAKSAKLGVWVALTETPWAYRARRWRVEEQVAPDKCPIKGNISDNGRIYHTPWSPWYSRTKISPEKGERWFCSEREALDAGWRAPLWGTQP